MQQMTEQTIADLRERGLLALEMGQISDAKALLTNSYEAISDK